jgi:hypothetical protein
MTDSARIPIGRRLRFEIFKRDGFICQYCGAHPPDAILEIDHIVPVHEGGGNEETNLISACWNCNRGKGGVSLTSVPKKLDEKAAEIQEREEQLAGYRVIVQAQTDRIEDDMWRVAEAIFPRCNEEDGKGVRRDWLQSIKNFNKLLPLHEVIDAAEIAFARKPFSDPQRFRYFCGVCWNKIKGGSE